MHTQLTWDQQGADWPHRAASRFIDAGDVHWHVQVMGQGPALLLLHGTGAATHSWRDLSPLLAKHFTVIAPDLPGHGFTVAPASQALSLPWMSRAIAALLQALQLQPAMVVGHSAGAAIGVRMILDHLISPAAVISLNGALLPPAGLAGLVFSPVAKLMAASSLVPKLVARRAADASAIHRLLASTGSQLEPKGVELYARLVSNEAHVRGVLAMMANWDLSSVERDMAGLLVPLLLVVGSHDGTVPPSEASRVRRLLPSAELITLPKLGHLAHEEQPQRVTELIMQFAAQHLMSEVS